MKLRTHTRRSLNLERLDDRITPAAGMLDVTFGNNGKVTTGIGSSDDGSLGVAMQSDGK